MFMTEFKGINDTQITDFNGLKTLGEQKMGEFMQALNSTSSTSDGHVYSVNANLILAFMVSTIFVYMQL